MFASLQIIYLISLLLTRGSLLYTLWLPFAFRVFNDNTAGYNSEVTFTKYADIEIYNQVIRLGPEYNVMVRIKLELLNRQHTMRKTT